MRASELAAQKRITQRFIDADSSSIVLNRRTRTADGAGGYSYGAPAPLPAQVCKVISLMDAASVSLRATEDGVMVSPAYVLVMMPGANVQRWDRFTMNGAEHEVVFVDDRQYEIKAEVVFRG